MPWVLFSGGAIISSAGFVRHIEGGWGWNAIFCLMKDGVFPPTFFWVTSTAQLLELMSSRSNIIQRQYRNVQYLYIRSATRASFLQALYVNSIESLFCKDPRTRIHMPRSEEMAHGPDVGCYRYIPEQFRYRHCSLGYIIGISVVDVLSQWTSKIQNLLCDCLFSAYLYSIACLWSLLLGFIILIS
jgi:hypothetical protein